MPCFEKIVSEDKLILAKKQRNKLALFFVMLRHWKQRNIE